MGRMNAPTTRYCFNCGKWQKVAKTHDLFVCPDCRNLQRNAKCNRCGYEWKLQRSSYPSNCPKCKSPYFNTVRIQTRGEDKE